MSSLVWRFFNILRYRAVTYKVDFYVIKQELFGHHLKTLYVQAIVK